MTLSDFEDPTELSRCARSDCQRYRLNQDTPLCAQHMREQEQSSAGFVEPDLERRLANVRTEDDDHPGMVKVYDQETGQASWVTAPENDPRLARPVPQTFVGPDPDTSWPVSPDPTDANNRSPVAPPLPPTSPPTTDNGRTGCWVTYYSDWSSVTLFDDEMAALRYAVASHMSVRWVTWGEELGGNRSPGATAGGEGDSLPGCS